MMEYRREKVQSIEGVGNVMTVGALGGGPTAEEFRKAQLESFGDPLEWVQAHGAGRYIVNDNGILCFKPAGPQSDSCLVVPPPLVREVLPFVH